MAFLERTRQDGNGSTEVDISSIVLPAILARESESKEDALASLSISMSRYGQIEPIVVRPKKGGMYELICGQRRLQAAKNLGWERVATRIIQADDRTVASMMLAENLERRDFTDVEIGKFFRKLAELHGMTVTEISEVSGRSKSYVSQHIAMTELFPTYLGPRPLVAEVMQSLTERQARILLKVSDANTRLAFARMAIRENLCVKELEKLVGKNPNGSIDDVLPLIRSKTSDYRPRDEEQIRDKVESLFDCVNNMNLQPLITFRDEEEFTLFDDFPPLSLQRGKNAIAHCFDVVESTKGGLKFQHTRPHVKTFRGFAIATFYVTYNGEGSRLRSRVSVVFQKKKEKWIIVHEHWSANRVSHTPRAKAVPEAKPEPLVGR